MKLRNWQQSAREKCINYFRDDEDGRHFVINAAPGAGKTKVSCVIAQDLLQAGQIDRVIIIAPRRTVVTQWAKEFAAVTGHHMMQITAADSVGLISENVCATWAAIKGLADVFQDICRTARVLVICDEHHHAAIEAAWGISADSAFASARYSLILTGTPVRSDGAQSIWLDRNELGGLAHPEGGMYTLTYGEAVGLGYCRPVTFHRHRGRFAVKIEDSETIEVSGDTPVVLPAKHPATQSLKRSLDFYRLAMTPQFEADHKTPRRDGYQGTMIACACDKLDELRLLMPAAGGLVIAPDINMAEHFAELIRMIDGQEPMVVHSGLPNAERRIDAFRADSSTRWLVAVGMVSEGVDIQRLRVLVYLPKAMTELAFRQAVGRVVRSAGPDDCSGAYVVMPSCVIFEDFARRIEDDMPAWIATAPGAPKIKACKHCGCPNPVDAGRCDGCGVEFSTREGRFVVCPGCKGLNPEAEAACQHCGTVLMPEYEITLNDAGRDGVIVRGIEVEEDEVRRAEQLAPGHLKRIGEIEDESLRRLLKTIPVELLPALERLLRMDPSQGS